MQVRVPVGGMGRVNKGGGMGDIDAGCGAGWWVGRGFYVKGWGGGVFCGRRMGGDGNMVGL